MLARPELELMFLVGLSDAFCENFSCAEQLMRLLAKLPPDSKERFMQRWNISTYYQIKQREIILAFEKGMT